MKHRTLKENQPPLRTPYPPLRKALRKPGSKSGRPKNCSPDSECTLSDTLTKSAYTDVCTCASPTQANSIPQPEKSQVIPPLKEILEESITVKSKSKKDRQKESSKVLCDYILLPDPGKRKEYEFRRFKEDEVPMFVPKMARVQLNEQGYDNDCQTDDEQIRSAVELMENEITAALSNYKAQRKEVSNIAKYECDRVIAQKKYRLL